MDKVNSAEEAMNIIASEHMVDEHLVLFMDFLGFSEASVANDPARAKEVLALLRDAKAQCGEFDIKHSDLTDGGVGVELTPEVLTFSDNLIASFPLYSGLLDSASTGLLGEEAKLRMLGMMRIMLVTMGLERARMLTASLALRALDLGLLIRGGITTGELYHRDGIVFGGGLVEAHSIESRTAVYPRIAVSPRVYGVPRLSKAHGEIGVDYDGIRFLDYIPRMIAVGRASDPEWERRAMGAIQRQVDALEAAERLPEFAKWAWFQRRFSEGLDGPPADASDKLELHWPLI